MMLVNVGCGSTVHPDWCNLDLEARIPGVRECDLRRGLPFSPDSCDAVYHSHVLEHLSRASARAMLAECFRVLKPGGILRVAVPNLEGIAREYLVQLERANLHPEAAGDHEWMTVELLDQMVRTESGGEMVRYLKDVNVPNRTFVRSRIGMEMRIDSAHRQPRPSLSFGRVWRGAKKAFRKLRQKAALTLVAIVAGSDIRENLKEAMFRESGEIHRWMYDRVSLRRLLSEIGFKEITLCDATGSRIPKFSDYQLDVVRGEIRKPDSLFMEASKPRIPV